MFKTIYNGNRVQVSISDKREETIVATFDHWSKGKKDFPKRKEQSFITKSGMTHLRISTKVNDWFSNEETIDAISMVGNVLSSYKRTLAMSFSMGAIALMLMSRFAKIDRSIFVSPTLGWRDGLLFNDKRFDAENVDQKYFNRIIREIYKSEPIHGESIAIFDPNLSMDSLYVKCLKELYTELLLVEIPNAGHPATRKITSHFGSGSLIDCLVGPKLDGSNLKDLWREIDQIAIANSTIEPLGSENL